MSDDEEDGPNWIESHPCHCGAKNWIARHMERVVVKMCCAIPIQIIKAPEKSPAKDDKSLARRDSLAAPEDKPRLVRRRSINNWRPIAGIFLVNQKDEDLNDMAMGHDNAPHEAIHVLFYCEKCGREFHCTYEIIDDEKGKRQSFGHYASLVEPITAGNCCNELHRYECIQRIYADMWNRDQFQAHYHNCRHWCDGFWWKVHPDEYKKRKAAENILGSRPLK